MKNFVFAMFGYLAVFNPLVIGAAEGDPKEVRNSLLSRANDNFPFPLLNSVFPKLELFDRAYRDDDGIENYHLVVEYEGTLNKNLISATTGLLQSIEYSQVQKLNAPVIESKNKLVYTERSMDFRFLVGR